MSAKEPYSKPNPHLPYVPVEIWKIIFREATGVPGPLEVQLATNTPAKRSTGEVGPEAVLQLLARGHNIAARRSHKIYRASLVTKRYLPRVCKEWYDTASPYLYEQVYMGRGRCLASLFSALKRSRKESGSENCLGRWTKRLDVSFRDFDPCVHELYLLANIIDELPNLTEIVFSVTATELRLVVLPSQVLQALGRHHSLKTIHWSHTLMLRPFIADWEHFLSKAPPLTAVGATVPLNPSFLPFRSRRVISLPSVTTYLLYPTSCILHSQINISMDNLQHLIFNVQPTSDWRVHLPIFRNITHLELWWLEGEYFLILSFTLENIIREFVNSCPRITRLDVVTSKWPYLSHLAFQGFPTTIRQLGLRSLALQWRGDQASQLFRALNDLLRQGARLKLIQLTDAANITELYKHPRTIENGLKLLKPYDVILLDDEGKELKYVGSSDIN